MKMKMALTIPAVNGNFWYNKFRAAWLPSVGTSSLTLPTTIEKPSIRAPIRTKRKSAKMYATRILFAIVKK